MSSISSPVAPLTSASPSLASSNEGAPPGPPGPLAAGRPYVVKALWVIWAAFLIVGSYGMYLRFDQGHLPAGYGSYVPWGLWIAIYFHGVGIAGGAFVLGALGYMLGWRGFRHPAALRAAIVLAFACIIPGFLAVALDLGHMGRAMNIFLTPHFGSMMTFNAWMYTAFMGVAALAWWLSYRPGSTWLKPVLALGVLLGIMFPSQSGAFFGVVDAKPYWHSALMPIIFLTSALTAGAALLLFIRGLIGYGSPAGTGENDPRIASVALSRIRKFVLMGLLIYFVLEFAEFSVSLWNTQTHTPAIDLVLFGPYWWVFWGVHVALGGVVPVALLLSRWRPGWLIAALLVAVTFISTRLNVLVPGQAIGEIKGLQEAFHHPRLDFTYHATAMEYLVGLFLVALGMGIFFIGRHLSKAYTRRVASQGKV